MPYLFLHRYVRPILIYGVLSLGSLVFAMPLLWMAATSVKTGREIVESPTSFWPTQPVPRSASPYLEPREFPGVSADRQTLLPAIRQRLKELGFTGPADFPADTVLDIAAAGVLQRLDYILPRDTWSLSPEERERAVVSKVSLEIAASALGRAERTLCLGSLMISSMDVDKEELVTVKDVASRWNTEPAAPGNVLQLKNVVKNEKQCGLISYQFAPESHTLRLSQTFAAKFSIDRLYRIQLTLLPDDSWNTLDIYVEKLGVLYKSSYGTTLGGNTNWTTLTWQEEGKDSKKSAVKIWTDLKEVDRKSSYESDPHKIKITLAIQRSGITSAWWNKISRNYEMAFRYIPFWRYLATTVFLVMITVVATTFSCSLVAYSFARLQWPGRDLCFILMLATMMIPSQVTMIPQFLIIRELGWYNSLLPLWVPHLFGNAFFIFLMVQFMKGIPKDLEDAAKIDGCGFFRIYLHIMLPLVRPTMVTVGVLTFVATWNDFMGPLIYVNDQQLYPLSFGLYAFTVQAGADVGLNTSMSMAASLLMTLPLIFLFLFAQRYFVQGVALSGMK